MEKTDVKKMNISENDILHMLDDTSRLIATEKASQLSLTIEAAQQSNSLADNVEFWNWMGRNWKDICASNNSMKEYIMQKATKEEWLARQVQAKGYEYDWMRQQRMKPENIFKTYDAGNVPNRPASDITERNIFSGGTKEYQMKAYTSNNTPDLASTPQDMAVVTNAEKTAAVEAKGYNEVIGFQDKNTIEKTTDKRMKQVKNGEAYTSYNIKNVAGTMFKSGLIGCAIGIGTEAVSSYKEWKSGKLTDKQYLTEILKSGGDAGVTAGATSGIMIPVSAAITAAGASTLLTIPIAFIVGGVVNQIVAPCFGRGKYREQLSQAKYYQHMESVYEDLTDSMKNACGQYYEFVSCMSRQNAIHEELKMQSMNLNKDLETLYRSI